MQDSPTWRESLGNMIQNPVERQRLVTQLGVNPQTLHRWVNGETEPRPQNLQRLLQVLPADQSLLRELLEAEFGRESAHLPVSHQQLDVSMQEVSGTFFARVLRTLATAPALLRFFSLCDLVLEQALKQLDSQRLGMAIIVCRCLPPTDGQVVRSLLESVGRGTPPWNANLEQEAILLGAESLTGYAVSQGHLVVQQDLSEQGASILPGYRGLWEESSVAVPITHLGKVGGCLLVSSAQPDSFPPARQQLVQSYADLLALAFEPEAFYDPAHIRLRVLPPQAVQQRYRGEFRQRLVQAQIQAARNRQPLTAIQAQQLVWQQYEDLFLQISSLPGEPSSQPDHPFSQQKELFHDK